MSRPAYNPAVLAEKSSLSFTSDEPVSACGRLLTRRRIARVSLRALSLVSIVVFQIACGSDELISYAPADSDPESEAKAPVEVVEDSSGEVPSGNEAHAVALLVNIPQKSTLVGIRLEAFIESPWSASTRTVTAGLRWTPCVNANTTQFIDRRIGTEWVQFGQGLAHTVGSQRAALQFPVGTTAAPLLEFRIRAVEGSTTNVSSPVSIPSSFQYPNPHTLATPTGLMATGLPSGRGIGLQWTDNESREPDGVVYQIECDLTPDGRFVEVARLPANRATHVFGSEFRLPGFSSTRFRVRLLPTGAAASGGRYQASAWAETAFNTAWDTAVSAPDNLRLGLYSQTPNSLKLEWQEDATIQSRYLVWYGAEGQLFASDVHTSNPPVQYLQTRTAECVVDNLTPGTAYTFFVQRLGAGDVPSLPSPRITAATCLAGAPSAPTNLRAELVYDPAQGNYWVQLRWENTSQNDGYEVLQTIGQRDELSRGIAFVADGTVGSAGPLAPGVRYAYRVRALRCSGIGASRFSAPSLAAEVMAPGVPPVSELEVRNNVTLQARFDIGDIRVDGVSQIVRLADGTVSDVIPGGQRGVMPGPAEGPHTLTYQYSFLNLVTNSRQWLPGIVSVSFSKEVFGRHSIAPQPQPGTRDLLRRFVDTQVWQGMGNDNNGNLRVRRLFFSRVQPGFASSEYGRLEDGNGIRIFDGSVQEVAGSTLTARNFRIGSSSIVFTLDLAFGNVSIPASAHGPMLLFPL